MYKHKHKIIFNDDSNFLLYGEDYFNENNQLWNNHQEKLTQFCTKVSNQGFPLTIIELNISESINIDSYKSFENWLNQNQHFRYKSGEKFSDNSQNEIAFLKGLLYSAECNSNYYCSSDLNVSYEFNILREDNENLHDLNFKKVKINNWILELHTRLNQWMFNQMPANPSKYYGHGKNELISIIVGKIENIINDLKDVYIVEYQDFAFVDGFEMVWIADKKYVLNIELND
ncbi:hypothetical protein I2486_16385 [Cellulophaga sp. E16_2]|uniref:hypothetical protein n=1 Tax=Cellulophaga sp. E16_2 TaxID=2789297 RepID=UPI001A90D913|nr:hypothetical protein [Cellulophaga sp. E16_2]MBO0592982.1 hypothetical protein [Cellulophaga sp. E16_2]